MTNAYLLHSVFPGIFENPSKNPEEETPPIDTPSIPQIFHPMIKDVTADRIRIRGGLVWIGGDGPLNEKSLETRIQNIEKNRDEYATKEAWEHYLQESVNALATLQSQEPTP